MLEIVEAAGAIRIRIRVAPRSSRDKILGMHDGALKVALTAPPVDGAANAALTKLLSKTLGVPKANVSIVRGQASRDKWVEIRGIEEDVVRGRF